MRLQTAVGMPVAMDSDGNMCIVVMFSPNNVTSNKASVEYLKSLCQGATSTSIPCLLPVMDSNTKKLEYNPKRFSDWEEHEDAEKQAQKNDENDAQSLDVSGCVFTMSIISTSYFHDIYLIFTSSHLCLFVCAFVRSFHAVIVID